jgi:UDP-N-acetylmuramoyl-L-alanyl-D-glutamate--2,6-diaminopimelate ligase
VKLGQLLAAAGACPPAGADAVEVADVAYRSQDVTPKALFVCVRGRTVDGHDLAPDAVERGAAALLVDHELPLEVPQGVVSDTRAAMGPLAAAFFGNPTAELPVVGVTGTNGKTTTAFLVAAICEAAGRPCGLVGTVERRIGGRRDKPALTTPEALDLQRSFRAMVDAGDRACAIEASSIAIAQHRLDGTRFAAVGFTNLTQDHLDYHGDMESYFAAKAELFDGRWPRTTNADDPWGRRLDAELRYAVEAEAEVQVEEMELTPTGTHLRLRTPRGRLDLDPRLRGRFNVDNVLCATALALLLDLPDEAIAAGVASMGGVPGRFEAVDEGQPFAVIVDYAHTPGGIEAVLRSARPLARGRVACVVGAGGDRDRAKRPLMGRAAEDGADRVYVTSDNPRSEPPEAIIAEVVAGLRRPAEAVVEPDRRAAIARALHEARAGDVVVIAGKGHEQGQDIGGVVHPFDDRTVARELLRGLVPEGAA